MGDSPSFASLSPRLLARKGGAKPAMRPHVPSLEDFQGLADDQSEDDLGWNDMGDETDATGPMGDVVQINGAGAGAQEVPDVVVRQQELLKTFNGAERTRISAVTQGRRAAFTLRIDAERHLKLRLASTVTNRSAQQILIEALDKLLDQMPEIQSLAANVRKRN